MLGLGTIVLNGTVPKDIAVNVAYSGGLGPNWPKESRCLNWFICRESQRRLSKSNSIEEICKALETIEEIRRSVVQIQYALNDPFVLLERPVDPDLEVARDHTSRYLRGAHLLAWAPDVPLYGGLLHTGPKASDPIYGDDVTVEKARANIKLLLKKLDGIYINIAALGNPRYGFFQTYPGTAIAQVSAALSQHLRTGEGNRNPRFAAGGSAVSRRLRTVVAQELGI